MPTRTNQRRAKRWCFTINNPQPEDRTDLETVREICTYLVWGCERGNTGTEHFQGYVEFRDRLRLSQVARHLRRAHLEAAKGTRQQAAAYCKKDGDYHEFGSLSGGDDDRHGEGKSRAGDLSNGLVIEAIRNGATKREIVEQFPTEWLKYHSAIEKTLKLYAREVIEPKYGPFKWSIAHDWLTSLMIVGPSGVGKTTWACTLIENPLLISHIDELRAFDAGFHGGIIFDDMSFEHIPRTSQIHLLDVDFQRAIHIRYGTVTLPKNVKKIFTTNTIHMFTMNDPAIARRITVFKCE